MIFLIYGLTLLLFPAAALWAWRRGGARALTFAALAAIGLVLGLALLVASPFGGNRLAGTHGYAQTAARTLQFAGLTWVLPLAAATGAVRAFAASFRPELVYAIACGAAVLAAVAGTLAAIYTMG